MASWVLDSSAVLACVRDEPGGRLVLGVLPDSIISAVNFCEVITKLLDQGIPEPGAFALASASSYAIVDFDFSLSQTAAGLRTATRSRGLSLGDRACLALGIREGLPVLTADRAWASLDIGVEIRLIR